MFTGSNSSKSKSANPCPSPFSSVFIRVPSVLETPGRFPARTILEQDAMRGELVANLVSPGEVTRLPSFVALVDFPFDLRFVEHRLDQHGVHRNRHRSMK